MVGWYEKEIESQLHNIEELYNIKESDNRIRQNRLINTRKRFEKDLENLFIALGREINTDGSRNTRLRSIAYQIGKDHYESLL